jgi:hypothetical protein
MSSDPHHHRGQNIPSVTAPRVKVLDAIAEIQYRPSMR